MCFYITKNQKKNPETDQTDVLKKENIINQIKLL